jgi:RNA polymerase sigma-70 factor (ECF subfamily)
VQHDDLAAALAADLDSGFERLVLAYQDRLYGFALRLIGNAPDAEEVAQDAFVRAYRALSRYPAERIQTLALRPWLFQICVNVVRNRWRDGPSAVMVSLDGDGNGGEAWEIPDTRLELPDARAERREQSHELAALVLELPERYRAAVVLRHVEGLGYSELAAALGQPVGTVKSNVHRGTALLREMLALRHAQQLSIR